MRAPYRKLFAIASWLPAIGVALMVWMTHDPLVARTLDAVSSLDFAALRQTPLATLVTLGAVIGTIALLQIGLGVVVALHLDNRKDIVGARRVLWPLTCIFVGSIALPLFYFRVLRHEAVA